MPDPYPRETNMSTQITFSSRSYAGESDLQPIVDFWNMADAADRLENPSSVDDLRLMLNFPSVDQQRDIRIWEDTEGRIVAYGRVSVEGSPETAEGRLNFHVHPETRNQAIEDELFAWAEE